MSSCPLNSTIFPPKILHGVLALGNQPMWIMNFPDYPYNAAQPDEHRMPYDMPIRLKDGTTGPYPWFRNTECKDLK